MPLLANAYADLPAMGNWILGLLGVLGAVALLLTVAKLVKDVFGRTPPISAELSKLNDEITRRETALRLEIQQQALALEKHRQEVNERFLSLNIERTRNLEALHEKINAVDKTLQRLIGKLDNRPL